MASNRSRRPFQLPEVRRSGEILQQSRRAAEGLGHWRKTRDVTQNSVPTGQTAINFQHPGYSVQLPKRKVDRNVKLPALRPPDKLRDSSFKTAGTTLMHLHQESVDPFALPTEKMDFVQVNTRNSKSTGRKQLGPLRRLPPPKRPLLSPGSTLRGLVRMDSEDNTVLRFRLSNYGAKDLYRPALDTS